MHSLTSGMLAQTQAPSLFPAVFIQIATPGADLFVWTGYGSIVWNAQTWTGLGYLLGVPSVTEVFNVQASGVQVTLSGIPANLVTTAKTGLQRYLPASIWVGAVDASGAVIASPYLLFVGRIDSASIKADGKTAQITVTIESRLIAMSRPRARFYTNYDQRIEFPNDGGFRLVEALQDDTIIWGQ